MRPIQHLLRRQLKLVVLCMLVGALAQFVVAYFCAVKTPFIGGAVAVPAISPGIDNKQETIELWQRYTPRNVVLEPHSADVRRQRTRDYWFITGTDSFEPYRDSLYFVEAGWPWRSMQGAMWIQRPTSPSIDELHAEAVKCVEAYSNGTPPTVSPDWIVTMHGAHLVRFDPLLPRLAPLTPMPTGFALNSAVYGFALLALWLCITFVISSIRHRAGARTRVAGWHTCFFVFVFTIAAIAQTFVAYRVAATPTKSLMPFTGLQTATFDDVQWWRNHAPAGFPQMASWSFEHRNTWRRVREMFYTPVDMTKTMDWEENNGLYSVETGWPFYSLQGSVWYEIMYDWDAYRKRDEERMLAFAEHKSVPPLFQHPERWFTDGAGDYKIIRRASPAVANPVIEPRRVILSGFIINTLLFGLPIWILALLPFAIRRRWRILHNRCAGCGYDLRAATGVRCAECGLDT